MNKIKILYSLYIFNFQC